MIETSGRKIQVDLSLNIKIMSELPVISLLIKSSYFLIDCTVVHYITFIT